MCDEDRPVYWWEEPCNWRDPDPPRHCYTCHYWLSCQKNVELDGHGYFRPYDTDRGYCVLIRPGKLVHRTNSCPHWRATVPAIDRGKQTLLVDLYQRIHRVLHEGEAPGDGTLDWFAAALRAFLKGEKPEEVGTDD